MGKKFLAIALWLLLLSEVVFGTMRNVTFTWDLNDPAEGVEYYTLYAGDSPGGPYSAELDAEAPPASIEIDIAPGDCKYFVLTASRGDTESGPSNEVNKCEADLLPPPPPPPVVDPPPLTPEPPPPLPPPATPSPPDTVPPVTTNPPQVIPPVTPVYTPAPSPAPPPVPSPLPPPPPPEELSPPPTVVEEPQPPPVIPPEDPATPEQDPIITPDPEPGDDPVVTTPVEDQKPGKSNKPKDRKDNGGRCFIGTIGG